MLLSAVSVLVIAQWSSEIPEGLMNNPVCSLIQLFIKQLLLQDISRHISHLHVSARFYGDIVFKKNVYNTF